MTAREIAVNLMLALGVAVTMVSVLGLATMRNAFMRLHCSGPITTLATLLIVAAVVANHGLSQAGIKAVLIALVLWSTGPFVTYATARVAYLREITPAHLPGEELRPRP